MRKAIEYFITQVESIDQLPELVGQEVRQHLPDETIRSIMIIPPQEQLLAPTGLARILWLGWEKIPQRTLVISENSIAVVEADKHGDLNTIVIPVSALTRITLGKVLLHAYVELVWIREGAFQTIKIVFNAVDDRYVNEQLNQVRSVIAADMHDVAQARDDDKTAVVDIEALPFKFRNYLKDSLLPAENVLTAVFSPVMRQPGLLYYRTIAPNRTVALTDKHVILVEEETDRFTSRYSVITHYYPLRHVRQVKFASTPDAVWMHMTVGTTETTQDVDVPLLREDAARLNHTFSSIPAVPVILATA